MRARRISLFAQSLLYIASGINHLWHSKFYLHIMPDHYSNPATLVRLSGEAEILCGVGLLIPATRRVSAYGIVLMLVLFLDVHQFMLRHPERFSAIPEWVLWARIPLQFALIAWAWSFMKERNRLRV
jgi:uncharacterized membrane protein